jgi:hypothetical protein
MDMKGLTIIAAASLLALCPASPLRGMEPGAEVRALVDNLEIGEPVTSGNLTLYPLKAARAPEPRGYLTLDEAMGKGLLAVTEKKGGSVPEVLITNRADVPIFIFAGEIITGAKQDRVVRQDALLAPRGGEMSLAVYCVEQGRWHGKSDAFRAGGTNAPSLLRKIAQWKGSQGEVWSAVRRVNEGLSVAPSTGTLQAAYESEENKRKFDACELELGRVPEAERGTVGVIACAGGRIVCGDLFCDHDLFHAEWRKLLRSYAADAVASSRLAAEPGKGEVRAFLLSLLSPESVEHERGVSLGENVRLTWKGGRAAGLLHGGAAVHLSLFNEGGTDGMPATGRVLGVGAREGLSRY